MAEQAVRFTSERNSGAIELEGRLQLPDAAVEAPGVVLSHPHPAGGGELGVPLMAVIADHLCSQGMAVLRFNFGGVGRSEGVFSDGVDEPADVRSAFDYLASLGEAEGENVSLVGWSFGAWMGMEAIADGLPARNIVAIALPLVAYHWENHAGRIAASMADRHYMVGDSDRFCPLATLETFAAAISEEDARNIHILSGADHFLIGREGEVARLVSGILTV